MHLLVPPAWGVEWGVENHMVQINKLTDAKARSLKEPGRYHDGLGLFLIVGPTGNKNWVFRFQLDGRKREMGLGSLNDVSLTDAREKRTAARQLLDMGQNPIEAKQAAQAVLRARPEAPVKKVPTFRDCAKSVIALKQPEWKNAKHGAQWGASLETYAYPTIGNLPVDQVTLDHILTILQPIWLTKNETANRVRGRIEIILGWARVRKYFHGDNPAAWNGNLEFLLQKPALVKKVRRQPSLGYASVPALMAKLLTMRTSPSAALATLILTALRSSEVRLAKSEELNRKGDLWSIPARRMKRPYVVDGEPQPHFVPIGPVELALLCRFGRERGAYLFPGANPEKAISETSVRKLIANHASDLPHFTMHGFRSSFKNWVMEQCDVPDKDLLSEAQLAHRLGSDVKVAYMRTTFTERRRELMRAWRTYCLSQTEKPVLLRLGLKPQQIEGLGRVAGDAQHPASQASH